MIAAAGSGSGKTTVTLALLRYLRRRGLVVGSAKVGPDYIDPRFHEAASGRPCFNLDPWAMRAGTLARLAERVADGVELVLVEGVMGLFDGATDGTGSTADLAALTGWPVVLVVDVKAQAQSAAALVHGFATWRRDLTLAGVILNRVGGPGHAELVRAALAPLGLPVLGAIPRQTELTVPERHLGLVQAGEHGDLEAFLNRAADHIGALVDTEALRALARPARVDSAAAEGGDLPPPLGQRIAVASDAAFAFAYPHLLAGWRAQGAELVPFSPLADQAPDGTADALYLPGGYPELHAGRLAGNRTFLEGVRAAAARGAVVFGECGGYMALGRGLVDGAGERHALAGLLPLETSFAPERRRLHLGYRRAVTRQAGPLGPAGTPWRGHEFHYAAVLAGEAAADALLTVADARGRDLGHAGAVAGTVAGSFIHLIDRA